MAADLESQGSQVFARGSHALYLLFQGVSVFATVGLVRLGVSVSPKVFAVEDFSLCANTTFFVTFLLGALSQFFCEPLKQTVVLFANVVQSLVFFFILLFASFFTGLNGRRLFSVLLGFLGFAAGAHFVSAFTSSLYHQPGTLHLFSVGVGLGGLFPAGVYAVAKHLWYKTSSKDDSFAVLALLLALGVLVALLNACLAFASPKPPAAENGFEVLARKQLYQAFSLSFFTRGYTAFLHLLLVVSLSYFSFFLGFPLLLNLKRNTLKTEDLLTVLLVVELTLVTFKFVVALLPKKLVALVKSEYLYVATLLQLSFVGFAFFFSFKKLEGFDKVAPKATFGFFLALVHGVASTFADVKATQVFGDDTDKESKSAALVFYGFLVVFAVFLGGVLAETVLHLNK